MYNLVLDKKFTGPLGKFSPGPVPVKNKISVPVPVPEPLCSSLPESLVLIIKFSDLFIDYLKDKFKKTKEMVKSFLINIGHIRLFFGVV
jgi:hypothetical protein